MEHNTPKHFVLQLGSLISLYITVSFLIVLLFAIIDVSFPDPTEGYYVLEGAASSIRLGIAMVLVFFPTYVVLTRIVNRLRRVESAGAYLTLTKWLIYLTLLVAAVVLLIDLAVVIMRFLEGDITQRFILKAVVVLGAVGATFYYYILDAQGFWLRNEQKSIMFGIGISVAVLASVVFGFSYIETPAAVREMKLDVQQIHDLQGIQTRIENYYMINKSLPSSLLELETQGTLPVAPNQRVPYQYGVTETGFRLCATFAHPSATPDVSYMLELDKEAFFLNAWNWEHTAGDVCFDRLVNKNATNNKPVN